MKGDLSENKVVNDDELRSLLIYSFRYALGRKSYATKEVADIIKKYGRVLTDSDRKHIIAQITICPDLGMDMDAKVWHELRDYLYGVMSE